MTDEKEPRMHGSEETGGHEANEPSGPEEEADVEEELKKLGRRFVDVLQAAWTSEERRRVQTEIRDGLERFGEEIEKLYDRTRESAAAQRVREKAQEARERASDAEWTRKTQVTMAQGLRRLSEELERLAERFTPSEKEASDEEPASGHDATTPDEPPS